MKYSVLIVYLCIISLIPNITQAQGCLQADVALLIDWSGSEAGNESLLIEAAQAFIDKLSLGEDEVKVTLLTFNAWAHTWCSLTSDRVKLQKGLDKMKETSPIGGTYLHDPLMFVKAEFSKDKRNVTRIIIIVSDGEIFDIDTAIEILTDIRETFPTVVYCIQIGGTQKDLYNLFRLSGSIENVGVSSAKELANDLKSLSLCN